MPRRLEKVLYAEAGFFALIGSGSAYEDAFVSTITPTGEWPRIQPAHLTAESASARRHVRLTFVHSACSLGSR